MACISEPVSWLRLEQHFLTHDAKVAEHVAACEACRACLTEIERDVVALPALVVPERRRPWWHFALPAFAAAVVLLVLLRSPERREDVTMIKGIGEVAIDVVRERAGAVREDVRTFAPGDRWKVVVTCPPDKGAWMYVMVTDESGTDYPIEPTHVACGNRVVVPGAFSISGNLPNRVCVRVATEKQPKAAPPRQRDDDIACITLLPEPGASAPP
jgi:anti-sigma factor ChrR (cupin superfamily)